MTQTHNPPQQVSRPERPLVATRHRNLLSRFTLAHGLMVLSGLLAFVLIAAVVGDRSEQMEVAVARADIPAGAVVGPTAGSSARRRARSVGCRRVGQAGTEPGRPLSS